MSHPWPAVFSDAEMTTALFYRLWPPQTRDVLLSLAIVVFDRLDGAGAVIATPHYPRTSCQGQTDDSHGKCRWGGTLSKENQRNQKDMEQYRKDRFAQTKVDAHRVALDLGVSGFPGQRFIPSLL